MPNWVTPIQAIAAHAKLHGQYAAPGGEESSWRNAESAVIELITRGVIQAFAQQSVYIFNFGPDHRENKPVTLQFWHSWEHTAFENKVADWVTGYLRINDVSPTGVKIFRADVVGLRLDADTIPWVIDSALTSAATPITNNLPATPRPPYDDVVKWCRRWIDDGKGNGMDKAWPVFARIPEHKGLSREHVFRPAWNQAKRK